VLPALSSVQEDLEERVLKGQWPDTIHSQVPVLQATSLKVPCVLRSEFE
jgi:DNA/RNA-binding domain of Phe-tRNA-synthetase-like protein